MIIIHVITNSHEIENHCLIANTRGGLIFLLSMLENNPIVLSFKVTDCNNSYVEVVSDIKTRFNISNTAFTKWKH